jgi:hypothetical protein
LHEQGLLLNWESIIAATLFPSDAETR